MLEYCKQYYQYRVNDAVHKLLSSEHKGKIFYFHLQYTYSKCRFFKLKILWVIKFL